jgi:hypothetical protein
MKKTGLLVAALMMSGCTTTMTTMATAPTGDGKFYQFSGTVKQNHSTRKIVITANGKKVMRGKGDREGHVLMTGMVDNKAANADCSGEPLQCEISLNLEHAATLKF